MAIKEQKRKTIWAYKITVSLWNGAVNCMIKCYVLSGYWICSEIEHNNYNKVCQNIWTITIT